MASAAQETHPLDENRETAPVITALQQGLAVTIAPQAMPLTTQQAAELLGVSRPTVIRLLDENKVPYERVGSYRKILLRDLLEYRTRRRAEQYAMLEATAVDTADHEDVEVVRRRLRAARRVVAGRYREASEGCADHRVFNPCRRRRS
ncbi:MAG TPA: helix-turn-helix domain-containing protein [Pseudonocardiaceae bacterium]|nr:helix-turn-helix domain-containing protein [Pseudonocardiaceae bacterium]